jgi:hypothetical protein
MIGMKIHKQTYHLSKNVRIKIYKTIILPVLYGCETWSLTLWEGQGLMMFENRVLSRIFRPKRDEVAGGCKKYGIRGSTLCTLHQILLGLSYQTG